jgi:hypothetical protein
MIKNTGEYYQNTEELRKPLEELRILKVTDELEISSVISSENKP